MHRDEVVHDNRLIDALYTLDTARRGSLELRYSRGLSLAEIAASLNLTPDAVKDLIEEGVERLLLALGIDSIDLGVALILMLTELPREAWGGQTTAEIVALARAELDRRGLSALQV